MSEQKNFDYTTENPVFIAQGPKDAKILKVRNLVPVEITYEEDGESKIVVAGVDYNSNSVVVNGWSGSPAKEFSDKFFNFVYKDMALPSDLFAEDRPSVPQDMPKEEDVQW